MNEYRLIAIWRIAAPQQAVFDTVSDSLRWPEWWPGADHVREIAPGDKDGVGSVRRYVWKGALPYRLEFDARATRVVTPDLLEASISGDLSGIGRWSFSHDAGVTTIHYAWHVRTTKRWMNILALFGRRFFTNNHHALMKQGAEMLARRLNAPLLAAEFSEVPRSSAADPAVNWFAAAVAGIVGGALATVAQMALWWAAAYSPIAMLLRDSRLAAAIVLGPDILPPPSDFDMRVMLLASIVHLVLSVAYGLAFAPLIARLPRVRALLLGGLLGLALFGVNMYGFTALYPWFEASRDWITATAHVVFGVSTAAAYLGCASRLHGISAVIQRHRRPRGALQRGKSGK